MRWKQSGSVFSQTGKLNSSCLKSRSVHIFNTPLLLFSSFFLSVHNLEFHPKEPVWAVQKNSQLLLPHYISCTGNKNTQFLFAGACSPPSSGHESWVFLPEIQIYVRAQKLVTHGLPKLSSASLLKHYTHTFNEINVVTLSLGCQALTAHQSAWVGEPGFQNFRLLVSEE